MLDKGKQEELIALLKERGKHTGYQMLPPCLEEAMGENIKDLSGCKGHDVSRYQWFKSKCSSLNGPVLDIGANLGYFSFRIIQDFKAKVIAYEPYRPQAQILSLIRDICEIDPNNVVIENKGVGLRDIESLPEAEMIILLNVLQHAGEDFDQELVISSAKWRDYAVEYLKKLKYKAPVIFFQMGYTWKGHSKKLCEDKDIIDFTVQLLDDAGWRVKHCGIVKKVDSSLFYEDETVSTTEHNAVFLKAWDNLPAKIMKKIIRAIWPEYFKIYRFAQRPLWICEVKD